MGAICCHENQSSDPTWPRIYKEDHYTLLLTKHESSRPCGFGEEDVLCFSHDTPGAGPYGPQGHGRDEL